LSANVRHRAGRRTPAGDNHDHLRNRLLAICHLVGLYLGDLLGAAIGVKANVGGVGIAMLLLISSGSTCDRGLMPKETEAGVGSGAPCTSRGGGDGGAAERGGRLARRAGGVLAAVLAAAACACLIALLSRTGDHEPLPPLPAEAVSH
jgi:hypothetical protein